MPNPLKTREERNKVAKAIISVMGNLQPHLRDVPDFQHKLWDQLFIMSDFELDVESPYPKTSEGSASSKTGTFGISSKFPEISFLWK